MSLYTDEAITNVKYRRIDEQKAVDDIINKLREDKVYSTMESEIASIGWEKAKKEVYEEDYTEEDKELRALNKKMYKYLREHNIDSLEIKYTCNKCKDTGYYNGGLCECVFKEIKRLQYKKYPFLENLNFDYSVYGDRQGYFNKIVTNYERMLLDNKISIFTLQGTAGVGKTYISYKLAKSMIERDKTVQVVNAIRLNKLFLEYHLAPLERKRSLLYDITYCDLLIIDDLGVEQAFNNVTIPYLYELIIDRMGKKTLITTNLDIKGIEEKYGQRIASRIMDKQNSILVKVKGKDLRL